MARLSVRFWGVRGSLATPGKTTARYGGNTACVEVCAGDERIVFDMGSGLRELGASLKGAAGTKTTFFLSHYHWDHILGLPFFGPAYDPRNELVIHGATRMGKSVREILAGQMINPYFPVSLGEFRASLQFRAIESGARIQVGPAVVTARELSHPGGALGFRVDCGDRSVVYATDFEHGSPADDALVDLAHGTDMLIYDAMFTVPEFPSHVGWGHSTWADGVKLAKRAKARQLMLFHYNPTHDDHQVDELLRLAQAKFPNTEAAREGREHVLAGEAKATRRAPVRAAAKSARKPAKSARKPAKKR